MRWFVKRYAARQGAPAFGRPLPLGTGAVIAVVGNRATARAVIRSTERWPDPVVIDADQDPARGRGD